MKYKVIFFIFSINCYADSTFINNGNSINNSTLNNSTIESKEVLTINNPKGDVYFLPTPDLPYKIDSKGLFWLSAIPPQKIRYQDISKKIEEYNEKTNAKWRLPSFFEIERISKNIDILGNYQNLEIWASADYKYPSFDLMLDQRYSGESFKDEMYNLLLVRDL